MMRQLAEDLRAEGLELYALLAGLAAADWARPTPFQDWPVNQVIRHLYEGDYLLGLSLRDPQRFLDFRSRRQADRDQGLEKPNQSYLGLQPLQGAELFGAWRDGFEILCDSLGEKDPKARVPWVGPDMSVRSAATARMMKTWAHGKDIYDLLRRPRRFHDRLRNIAHLGTTTFAWTFANRGLEMPGPIPFVQLTAPSGAVWPWGQTNNSERITGTAVDFCRIVTQGRNIADVDLKVSGPVALQWMELAQCFAGPPKDPLAPGQRAWDEAPNH